MLLRQWHQTSEAVVLNLESDRTWQDEAKDPTVRLAIKSIENQYFMNVYQLVLKIGHHLIGLLLNDLETGVGE